RSFTIASRLRPCRKIVGNVEQAKQAQNLRANQPRSSLRPLRGMEVSFLLIGRRSASAAAPTAGFPTGSDRQQHRRRTRDRGGSLVEAPSIAAHVSELRCWARRSKERIAARTCGHHRENERRKSYKTPETTRWRLSCRSSVPSRPSPVHREPFPQDKKIPEKCS